MQLYCLCSQVMNFWTCWPISIGYSRELVMLEAITFLEIVNEVRNWWLERGGRLQNDLSNFLSCSACQGPVPVCTTTARDSSHPGPLRDWKRGASLLWAFWAVTVAERYRLKQAVWGSEVIGCWDLVQNEKCD